MESESRSLYTEVCDRWNEGNFLCVLVLQNMWNMIIFSLFDFNQKGHMVCFCNLLLQHGSGVTQIIESARLIHQQKFHKEQAGYTTREVVIWILYETIWTCTLKSVHQYLLCFRFFIRWPNPGTKFWPWETSWTHGSSCPIIKLQCLWSGWRCWRMPSWSGLSVFIRSVRPCPSPAVITVLWLQSYIACLMLYAHQHTIKPYANLPLQCSWSSTWWKLHIKRDAKVLLLIKGNAAHKVHQPAVTPVITNTVGHTNNEESILMNHTSRGFYTNNEEPILIIHADSQ